MKYLIPLFLLLMFPTSLWSACGGSSPTWTAASASQTDVAECITGATDGDTVNVPSGTGTGTGRTNITKTIILTGAGIASTSINYGFYITTGGDDTVISGIRFTGAAPIKITSGTDYSGTPIPGLRITGCQFDSTTNGVISFHNGSTGLVDNCTFPTFNGTDAAIYTYGRDGTDWSNASDWGGAGRYVFIEDNLFQGTFNHAVLGSWGASYVARCNKTIGGGDTFDVHGYGHGTNRHGGRAVEIYGNSINNQRWTRTMQFRGGSGRIFTNRWSVCGAACQSSTFGAAGAGISLFDNRMPGSANNLAMAYPADGADCTSASSSTCTTANQSTCCSGTEGYPCCGQVGRGQSGSGDNNQTLDPLYLWDNTDVSGNAVGTSVQTGAEAYFTLNTDYYASSSPEAFPVGYTPYTYPHPDRGIAATTTCLTGVDSQADTAIKFWGTAGAVSGTITSFAMTESTLVSGGATLDITIYNDTLEANINAYHAEFIAGCLSKIGAATLPNGWNAEIVADEVVTAITRVNDTLLRWTLSANAAYAIDRNDGLIACYIPHEMLVMATEDIVPTPAFFISNETPIQPRPIGTHSATGQMGQNSTSGARIVSP